MGKILKIISYWLLGALATVMILMAGTITWIYHHPKETWAFFQKHFLPDDLKITWDEMQFSAQHLQKYDFQFDLKLDGLLIQKTQPALYLPIEKLHLKSSLLLSNDQQKLILHQVAIRSSKTLSFIPEPATEPEVAQNPFEMAQPIFTLLNRVHAWAKIENLDLEISQFHLGKVPLILEIQAVQHQKNEALGSLSYDLKIRPGQRKTWQLSSKGDLRLSLLDSDQSFLEGSLIAEGLGFQTTQNFTLHYHQEVASLRTKGLVDYKSSATKSRLHVIAQPDLQLDMKEDGAELQLQSNFKGIPGPLVKIDQLQANFKIPFEKGIFWSEKASDFKVSAPLGVFFVDRDLRQQMEKSCQCQFPRILQTEAKGRAWVAALLSESEKEAQVLDVQMTSESVQNKWLSLDLAADLKAWKKDSNWIYKPIFNTTAKIQSFQVLRQFLDAQNILVPAPFDVLEGTLSLRAVGPVEISKESFTFPLWISADLASPHQKVKVETKTSMRLRSDFKEGFADVKVRVSDFQIELPPLDPLKGRPRVTLDKRILRSPTALKKKKSPFKMSFAVDVETVKPGAVRLMSEYFKPMMPLTVNVQHSIDRENSGFVQTEPFAVEYLRRTVHVEKMRIDLSQSEDGILPVDGRFRIQQAGYLIFIEVKGTTNSPNIKMSSDPYLPESEIISVLLYGRTSDQLISADAETAGSVQAAMADRAIGLFGLWAFAATPIQSFSYNPVTKVYTATLSLGDGVTAGIGTNWESATNLALRKRVSKRWVLTAEWTPASQDEEQSTRLVLQWERRF